MIKKKRHKINSKIITINKHALNEYFIELELEAGILLHGWEVKSLRAGKVNIRNNYIMVINSQVFLLGANLSPLGSFAPNYAYDPTRTRKLLLNRYEIDSLQGYVKRTGYTIVALSLYWKRAWCKAKIGIVKGKKQHDKRSDIKSREWLIEKNRILKIKNNNFRLN